MTFPVGLSGFLHFVAALAATSISTTPLAAGLLQAAAAAPDPSGKAIEQPSVDQPSRVVDQPVDPLAPIAPITSARRPWPSPNLNPGVPSAFVAQWGDVFVGVTGATAGNQRGGNLDGSWVAGFGLGSSTRSVALEVNAGCGSINRFCDNGGLGFRVGRVLVQKSRSWLAIAGSWQNAVEWSSEGDQDNIYSATVSYAFPLRAIDSHFAQTFQINAGIGNSTFAPYTATDSQDKFGAFGSIGVELTPSIGLSTGWSGRGMNAQISYTPFSNTPLTLNLLGADLFNQNPEGPVAVFSITWGSNFRTPNFQQ